MAITKPQVRAVWGEAAASTDVVDPGAGLYKSGFPQSAVPPARQFINWLFNYCTNAIRYLSRRGISDYDPIETYELHDIVRGDDHGLYQSLASDNIGHVPSASPSHWGNVALYRRTAAELSAGVIPKNMGYPELNVLRYGADDGGVAASDDAIAQALAVACPMLGQPHSARQVYFPAGRYLVTRPIDLTNTRQPGTRIKDGLLMKGESAGCSVIVGQTGAGKPVIETTGSQWLSIEDLRITTSATGHSTVGVFQGMSSALMQTSNQRLSRLVIMMKDDAASNGGAGSVGIWNLAAEENTYDTLWISANLPLMFTAHNPSPNTGFKTPFSYQSLISSHSLGVSTFTGECYFVTINKRQPSIITEDANSMKFTNTYFAAVGGMGENQSAWKVFGSLVGLDFNGLVESHARLLDVTGVVIGAKMRVTFGGVDSPTTERIRLNRGGQGQLLNCEFNITDNVATKRQLLSAAPASVREPISCAMTNCSVRINAEHQFIAIPENLLWNPITGNVTIEGLRRANQPYRYSIDSNRAQKVGIPKMSCEAPVVEIVRIMLPTVAGNLNGLSARVSVEGIVHVSASNAETSCQVVDFRCSFTVSNSGALNIVSDSRVADTPAWLAISASNGGGGLYVTIAAARSPAARADEMIEFVGSAQLQWAGNEARAPQLMILS